MSEERGNRPKKLEDISHLFLSAKSAGSGEENRSWSRDSGKNSASRAEQTQEVFLLLLIQPGKCKEPFASLLPNLLSPLAKEIVFVNLHTGKDGKREEAKRVPKRACPANFREIPAAHGLAASLQEDSETRSHQHGGIDGRLFFLSLPLEKEKRIHEAASLARGMVVLVPPNEAGIEEAYRAIKAAYSAAKHLVADVLLLGKSSKEAVEAFSGEFQSIVERFLHRGIDFHGSCSIGSLSFRNGATPADPCLKSLLASLEGKLKAWHFRRNP